MRSTLLISALCALPVACAVPIDAPEAALTDAEPDDASPVDGSASAAATPPIDEQLVVLDRAASADAPAATVDAPTAAPGAPISAPSEVPSSPATDAPSKPSVELDPEGTSAWVRGLPAISADGTMMAVYTPGPGDNSEASLSGVDFVRTRGMAHVETFVLMETDEMGDRLPLPRDGRGSTLWRRTRNVQAQLDAGGYRSLVNLETEFEPYYGEGSPIFESDAFIVSQNARANRLVIRDATTRRRLWAGRFERMGYFCGMSDDYPTMRYPTLLGVDVDPPTRTALLTYGHIYPSCMCEDDYAFRVVRFGR